MGCGNSRQLDQQLDNPVQLKSSMKDQADEQNLSTMSTATPVPAVISPVFKGVKVGLQLLCKDEFVSKYTGDKMCRWRKSEIRTVENSDNSKVLIHYVGWSENFDFWLDLHSEWSKVAHSDLLSKNQCDQGLPLTEEQERITHNYLVTGKFSKRNLPPLHRSNSNSTTQSINSHNAAAANNNNVTTDNSPAVSKISSTQQLKHDLSNSSNSIIGYSSQQQQQEQFGEEQEYLSAEAMVPHYYVGQLIDVQDVFFKKTSETPMYKWRKASVIKVMGDKSTIRIHYVGWDAKFDETLHLVKDAHRISAYDTMTASLELSKMQHILPQFASYSGNSTIMIGNGERRRSFDNGSQSQKTALQQMNSKSATAIDTSDKKNVSSSSKKTRSKYLNWISLSGKKSAAAEEAPVIAEVQQIVGDATGAEVAVGEAVEGQLEEEDFDEHFAARERLFVEMMDRKGLHVVEIEGDGNCLFRAVSHQLFLTEDKHEELRALCVKHLLKHKERFEMFCSTNFDEHIAEMSQLGTWGDDLEIRALEEITDRLMSIHCSDIEEDFYERHIHKNKTNEGGGDSAAAGQTNGATMSNNNNNSNINSGGNKATGISATVLETLPTIDDFTEKEIDMITAPIHKNFEEDALLKGVAPISLSYHGQNHYNSVCNEKIPLPLEVRTSRVLMKARMELFHCTISPTSSSASKKQQQLQQFGSSPASPSHVTPVLLHQSSSSSSPTMITPVRLDATFHSHSGGHGHMHQRQQQQQFSHQQQHNPHSQHPVNNHHQQYQQQHRHQHQQYSSPPLHSAGHQQTQNQGAHFVGSQQRKNVK